jgi:hypothetical protein
MLSIFLIDNFEIVSATNSEENFTSIFWRKQNLQKSLML